MILFFLEALDMGGPCYNPKCLNNKTDLLLLSFSYVISIVWWKSTFLTDNKTKPDHKYIHTCNALLQGAGKQLHVLDPARLGFQRILCF